MFAMPLHLELQETSLSLIELHRALLKVEQHRYEQTHDRVAPAKMLDLLAFHPDFDWLRAFSGMIVEIDERLSEPTIVTASEAAALRSRIEERLGGQDSAGVQLREAVQSDPEVAIGLGRLRLALAKIPRKAPATGLALAT